MNGENDRVSLRRGQYEISLRGSLTIVIVVLAVIGTANSYLVERGFNRLIDELKTQRGLIEIESARRMSEHAAITRSQDRTSCLLALTPVDRERFRLEWRPGAFARWCPWIYEDLASSMGDKR